MVTLTMNVNEAIAVHDCLARQIDELIEHGWTIDRINDIPEYKHLIDKCNEIADAIPEAQLEKF